MFTSRVVLVVKIFLLFKCSGYCIYRLEFETVFIYVGPPETLVFDRFLLVTPIQNGHGTVTARLITHLVPQDSEDCLLISAVLMAIRVSREIPK